MLSLAMVELMAAKAWLVGAKTVISGRAFTVLRRFVLVRADARLVRPLACAVLVMFAGTVNTELMTWIIPPSNLTSYSVVSQRFLLIQAQSTYSLSNV